MRDAGTVPLFALLLAFWVAGSNPERHQAVAGAAVGFATVAVLASRVAAPPADDESLLPGGSLDIGGLSLEVVFVVSLAAGVWLMAHSLGAPCRAGEGTRGARRTDSSASVKSGRGRRRLSSGAESRVTSAT